jgi:hypothetical protein
LLRYLVDCPRALTKRSLAAGTCALTFGLRVFQSSNAAWANVTGNIGTGIFPGATKVLNRTSNTLQPCTKELCPLAVASAQAQQLVNFAPLYTVYRSQMLLATAVTGEAMGGMFSLTSFMLSLIPVAYLTALAAALGSFHPSSGPNTSASLTPSSSPFDPQPLAAIGYDVNDTLAYLPAAFSAMTHSNQLQDIALPGASYYRCGSVGTASQLHMLHDFLETTAGIRTGTARPMDKSCTKQMRAWACNICD